MKNTFKIILTGVVLAYSALVTQAQTGKTMETQKLTEEQKEVLNAVLNMTSAFHSKNIDGVMSSYENDATVVFEPEHSVSDRSEIRESFNGLFSIDPEFKYGGHEVFVNNNIAIHFAPWSMMGKGPDGSTIEQSGLSVAVLRKQKDGKWLMVFDNPHGQYLLDKN